MIVSRNGRRAEPGERVEVALAPAAATHVYTHGLGYIPMAQLVVAGRLVGTKTTIDDRTITIEAQDPFTGTLILI